MKWILAAVILLGGSGVWTHAATQEGGTAAKKQEAPKPQRIRMGGNVQSAKALERTAPVYPPLARTARISGTVKLHAIIGTDGTVKQLEVVSGHPLLVQSALDAVWKWRYGPTLLNGEALEVDTTIDVVYSLYEGGQSPFPPPSGPVIGGVIQLQPSVEDPALKTAILHLFDVMHFKETSAQGGRAMFDSIRPMLLRTLPAIPNRDKILDTYMEKLLVLMQGDEMRDRSAEVYARHFSLEDVKGITQFFETPAGQHYITAIPQLVGETSLVGQQQAMKNMGRIWKELCDEYPELGGKLSGCAVKEPEKKSQL
jgi:TonB family protein